MTLVDVVAVAGEDADEVLRLAGAVEDASEHPIGARRRRGARGARGRRSRTVEDFARHGRPRRPRHGRGPRR